MYMFITNPYNSISLGLALSGYAVGTLGAFSVYKFADMSIKLVVLSLTIGQLFFMNVLFAWYRSPKVSVLRESPNITPQDSPQREGVRRSQELTPPRTQEPGSNS